MRRRVLQAQACSVLLAIYCFLPLAMGKEKDPVSQMVDSGSFGVFQGGQRVATETFTIQQKADGSIAHSEFKTEVIGGQSASQSSQLELSPTGEIRRYEWKELSPGKADAVVIPSDAFLTERYRDTPEAKEKEQPFILPASTSILDDYSFVQREILVWKYLATSCKRDKGQLQCPLKQEFTFGTLNPHARSSLTVSLAFQGTEKVPVRGTERNLTKLELKSELYDWSLWIDEQFKLVRIVSADTNTEVVRD